MPLVEIFAIAVALAMDAFAVSVAVAASLPIFTWKHALRFPASFGLFQFLMPVLGWGMGRSIHCYIERWDHWIAFALLVLVAFGMLKEAWIGKKEKQPREDVSRGFMLLMLSVATSIDALAVGLSFAMLGISVWRPALVIGLVCAAITMAGLALGRVAGKLKFLGGKAQVFGALVLLGIGIRILHGHHVF